MSTATTQLANRNGEPAPAIPETPALTPETLERVMLDGDLSKLNSRQRLEWYRARCEAAGLDPRGQPFTYLQLQGKLVLYANKGCTDQLTGSRKLSVAITRRETDPESGICVVHCRATFPDGHFVDDAGALFVGNLKGEALANGIMKATTKAKRRTVLSACGLGMLDETEVETIADARVIGPEAPSALPPPANNSGHGRSGAYASPETIDAFLAALRPIVEHGQDRWENLCDRYATGEVPKRYRDEMIRGSYACRHLIKAAAEKGLIKAPDDVLDPTTRKTRSGVKDHQLHGLAALAWQRDGAWAEAEVRAWLDTAIAKGQAKLVKEGLLDPADFPVDPEPSPEDESQERAPGEEG